MNGNGVVAIVNPGSAGGKTGRSRSRVSKALPEGTEVIQTQAPGHAIELTAAALRSGARTVIAVGGDGTINEVVNGFFAGGPAASEAVLGIIPRGTGSDFSRSLNLPLDTKEAGFVIENAVPRPIDVMRVHYVGHDDLPATRYAINMMSFGLGGLVAGRSRPLSKIVGGKAGFVLTTALATFDYAGKPVTLTFDRARKIEARITNVAVGNGQYQGAGMRLCPNAKLDDGLLDVTVIQYLGLLEITANLSMLRNGKILEHPKVQSYRASHIVGESAETTMIEIDGEPLGKLPVEIEVLPRAIRVLM